MFKKKIFTIELEDERKASALKVSNKTESRIELRLCTLTVFLETCTLKYILFKLLKKDELLSLIN